MVRVKLIKENSRAIPGTFSVLIVGPTEQSVSDMITEVMGDDVNCCFIPPILCPDGEWSSYGRVSR